MNIPKEVFSDRYARSNVNLVELIMYRASYPVAVLLSRLRLSPNHITTLSLAFSILAFSALILDEGIALFSVFWGISVLLDFCDGTVARMTNQISKSAFRYDHMSDLFKISLIFLGVGLRYDDILTWVLSIATCFMFMYADALNRERRYAGNKKAETGAASPSESGVRRRDRYRLVDWLVKYDLLYKFYKKSIAVLLVVNGHTLLVFFLFAHGPELTAWVLSYLIVINLLAIRSHISRLVAMQR